MKRRLQRMSLALGLWALTGWLAADALAQQITSLDFVPRLTIQSEIGITNQIQYTNNFSSSNWAVLATVVVTQSPYTFLDLSAPPAPRRFYRVVVLPPAGLVWIPAGTFTMGSPDSEAGRWSAEGPQTQVTINRGFFMGKYEVTQGEYLAVMGNNPSWCNGDRAWDQNYGNDLTRPVEQVSWKNATNYCAKLTTMERNAGGLPAGYKFRLPTDAEWEYACRAGTTTPFSFGSELHSRDGNANFDGRYEYPPCGESDSYCVNYDGICQGTTPVGSYPPNAWGLYDMHGNVLEWCANPWWYLPGGSVTDPQGNATDLYRMMRGGGWVDEAYWCRSAARLAWRMDQTNNSFGFRVVLAPVQP